MLNAPLALTLTPQVLAVASDDATEKALAMNRTQRRKVQLRLNVAGFNVGSPDGAIGPKTRAGLRAWQTANGFLATGYLNNVQHHAIVRPGILYDRV